MWYEGEILYRDYPKLISDKLSENGWEMISSNVGVYPSGTADGYVHKMVKSNGQICVIRIANTYFSNNVNINIQTRSTRVNNGFYLEMADDYTPNTTPNTNGFFKNKFSRNEYVTYSNSYNSIIDNGIDNNYIHYRISINDNRLILITKNNRVLFNNIHYTEFEPQIIYMGFINLLATNGYRYKVVFNNSQYSSSYILPGIDSKRDIKYDTNSNINESNFFIHKNDVFRNNAEIRFSPYLITSPEDKQLTGFLDGIFLSSTLIGNSNLNELVDRTIVYDNKNYELITNPISAFHSSLTDTRRVNNFNDSSFIYNYYYGLNDQNIYAMNKKSYLLIEKK